MEGSVRRNLSLEICSSGDGCYANSFETYGTVFGTEGRVRNSYFSRLTSLVNGNLLLVGNFTSAPRLMPPSMQHESQKAHIFSSDGRLLAAIDAFPINEKRDIVLVAALSVNIGSAGMRQVLITGGAQIYQDGDQNEKGARRNAFLYEYAPAKPQRPRQVPEAASRDEVGTLLWRDCSSPWLDF